MRLSQEKAAMSNLNKALKLLEKVTLYIAVSKAVDVINKKPAKKRKKKK